MAVNVTETAAREICSIIKDQELDPAKIRLRVGVKGGGCSGFSYLLDLTETQKDSDEMWEFTYTIPGKSSAEAGASQAVNQANGAGNGAVALLPQSPDEGYGGGHNNDNSAVSVCSDQFVQATAVP